MNLVTFKIISLFSVLTIASYAGASELVIHSVVPDTSETGSYLIKFTNGQVAFWTKQPSDDQLPQALVNKTISAQIDQQHQLITYEVLPTELKLESTGQYKSSQKQLSEPFTYQPTIYRDYQQATEALNSFRQGYLEDAQCYDKSHIWVHEELANYKAKLMKVFLFFSDSYIQRFRYPWWFHTAPYAMVSMNGEVNERVMDASFSQYPLQFKIWTDLFMKNQASCKVITKYSEYANHPGEDDCYMIKTHIFHWQPKDLQSFETTGVEKTNLIYSEVMHSYKAGFGLQL